MNVRWYRFRNSFSKMRDRITHPWPVYKKVGGISAVVTRANGNVEDLGSVTTSYAKRWGVGTGAPEDEVETDG